MRARSGLENSPDPAGALVVQPFPLQRWPGVLSSSLRQPVAFGGITHGVGLLCCYGFRQEDRPRNGARARSRQELQQHHQASGSGCGLSVHPGGRGSAIGHDRRADVQAPVRGGAGRRRSVHDQPERNLRTRRSLCAETASDDHHRRKQVHHSLRRDPYRHQSLRASRIEHRLRGSDPDAELW